MKIEDLSPLLQVSVEIYKMQLKKEKASITKLRKTLSNINIQETINKGLDLGAIKIEWISKNGGFLSYYYINPEMEILIQRICIDLGEIEIKVKDK
jgi:hypothetical protein